MNSKEHILNVWEEFKKDIMYNYRFFPEEEELLKILNSVLPELLEFILFYVHKKLIPFGNKIKVYRARKGIHNTKKDIGMPGPEVRINDKRCNPKGIRYFYTSSTKDTAIYEIRPEINEKISVGTFKSIDSLKVLKLSLEAANAVEREISPKPLSDIARYLLEILIDEISKPIGREESLEYVPIQYIVEYIKQYHKLNHKEDSDKTSKEKPIDGLSYKSSLTGESNYLFFSDTKFELADDIKHIKISKIERKIEYEVIKKTIQNN